MSDITDKPLKASGGSILRSVLIGILGLVAVGAGLLQMSTGLHTLFEGTSADSVVTDGARRATGAAQDFLAMTKDVYKTGNPPRLSDPKAGPLIDGVFNTHALEGRSDLTFADAGSLAKWSFAAAQVGTIYITSGTGISDPMQATSDAAAKKINQNVVAFAPEMGRYMDTSIVINGAMADALRADFAKPASSQTSAEGKAKVQAGMTQTIVGVMQTLVTDGLSDDWRLDRVNRLDGVAPKLPSVVTFDQCRTLHDTAGQIAGALTDPKVKKGLQTFADGLACKG